MEQGYLIDSNAVIDYLAEKLPVPGMDFMHGIINDIPNISIITKIEVLGFNAPKENYDLLASFMDDANILGLTENVVETTIMYRKNHRIKLPDALIASTAWVNDLVLITRNTPDFKIIENLRVLNPHRL